jgi:hypothetical protein
MTLQAYPELSKCNLKDKKNNLPEALGCQQLAETSQIVFYCDFSRNCSLKIGLES